jgi:hypothetical protein
MKFFTVLAAAAAVFTGFVAASPIAAPAAVAVAAPSYVESAELVPRGDSAAAEKDIIAILVALNLEIDGCNKKWTDLCKAGKCNSGHVKDYAVEVAAIINIKIAEIKAKIFVGLKIVDIDLVVKLVVDLLVKINITLNLLCKGLGLVGGLLVNLLLILCVDLKIALNGLLACLAIIVDGLLIKVQILLGGLLGGLLCLVCSLLGLVL